MDRFRQLTRGWLLTLLFFACVGALATAAVLLISGCDSLRLAPSEPQKKLAFQATITARDVESAGTDAHSPAARQLVDATEVALSYMGVPATPQIEDYPTTVAQAASDAVRRPTADEVWSEADGWIDLGIALAGLFGGAGGIAATQLLVKARQKSRALREVVAGNEKLKEWLRAEGKTLELDTFYDFQNEKQSGRTEVLVTDVRSELKDAGSAMNKSATEGTESTEGK